MVNFGGAKPIEITWSEGGTMWNLEHCIEITWAVVEQCGIRWSKSIEIT
jgi:hypothetical protein